MECYDQAFSAIPSSSPSGCFRCYRVEVSISHPFIPSVSSSQAATDSVSLVVSMTVDRVEYPSLHRGFASANTSPSRVGVANQPYRLFHAPCSASCTTSSRLAASYPRAIAFFKAILVNFAFQITPVLHTCQRAYFKSYSKPKYSLLLF